MFVKSRLVLICNLLAPMAALIAGPMARADVSVIWNVTGPEQELKKWDSGALNQLKTVSSQEKDPASGKLTHYKGVLLSQLLDKTMASLPVERKAQVDLLVLKNAAGGQVLLPRSVVTKYPVLVALEEGSKASIVMPWTSQPKILKENLAIESYFVSGLARIELSNYRERYGSVFLNRRTDPLAMRGEKLFVQNCVACHSDNGKPTLADLVGISQTRKLASEAHPSQVKGVPRLNDGDRRALTSYLEAYRAEKTQKAASPTGVQGGAAHAWFSSHG